MSPIAGPSPQGRNCFHHLARSLSRSGCNRGALAAALRVLLPVAGGVEALNAGAPDGMPPLGSGILGMDDHYAQPWEPRCDGVPACIRVLVEHGADPLASFKLSMYSWPRTIAQHLACYALLSKGAAGCWHLGAALLVRALPRLWLAPGWDCRGPPAQLGLSQKCKIGVVAKSARQGLSHKVQVRACLRLGPVTARSTETCTVQPSSGVVCSCCALCWMLGLT